jgi:hypothetical protein
VRVWCAHNTSACTLKTARNVDAEKAIVACTLCCTVSRCVADGRSNREQPPARRRTSPTKPCCMQRHGTHSKQMPTSRFSNQHRHASAQFRFSAMHPLFLAHLAQDAALRLAGRHSGDAPTEASSPDWHEGDARRYLTGYFSWECLVTPIGEHCWTRLGPGYAAPSATRRRCARTGWARTRSGRLGTRRCTATGRCPEQLWRFGVCAERRPGRGGGGPVPDAVGLPRPAVAA